MMRCYAKHIQNQILVIHLEESLYTVSPTLFDAIFKTYETYPIINGRELIDTILITTASERQDDGRYLRCIQCDVTKDQWKYWLIDDLDEWYATKLNCTVLHGAGLRWQGKNFLVIGESMSGKSTLSFDLCAKYGAEYLDDDCIYYIDRKYYGFAMPLALRREIRDEEINDAWKLVGYTDDAMMQNRQLIAFSEQIECMETIDYIIFPHYNPLLYNSCKKKEGAELLNALMHSVRSSCGVHALFSDISEIVRNIVAYELTYVSSDDAINMLKNL